MDYETNKYSLRKYKQLIIFASINRLGSCGFESKDFAFIGPGSHGVNKT